MSQSRDSRFSISASRDTSNDTTTTTTVTGNNMSIFGDTRGKNEEENEQVVLISSAASGIGRGIAVAFAALNYRLVLVDENLESLSETSRLCREKYAKTATTGKSRKPLEFCIDLSAGDHIARSLVQSTIIQFGRLDILINIAAYRVSTKFNEETCIQLYHETIARNVNSVVYLSLASFEWLKKSKGSIVNVSSSLDDRPSKFMFAYCASKAAISMLTKCLANDFSPFVRVNCVSSGPIASTILDDMGIEWSEDSESVKQSDKWTAKQHDDSCNISSPGAANGNGKTLSKHSLAESGSMVQQYRVGEPEKVAKMIIYLSSKEGASFITGSRVLLDGGASF